MITSTPHPSTLQSSAVTVDWSELFTSDAEDTQTNIPSLLSWVSSYPNRKKIHVYLGSINRSPRYRSFKNTLQSLGCTVTTRHVLC